MKADAKKRKASSEHKETLNDHTFQLDTKSQYFSPKDADYNPIEDEDFISNVAIPKNDSMRVCLRIRPMTKWETNRRSKDCFTVHQDSQMFTIDSPMDGGQHDFTYDKVCIFFSSKFDEILLFTEIVLTKTSLSFRSLIRNHHKQ